VRASSRLGGHRALTPPRGHPPRRAQLRLVPALPRVCTPSRVSSC
jgi:hypothetical protein